MCLSIVLILIFIMTKFLSIEFHTVKNNFDIVSNYLSVLDHIDLMHLFENLIILIPFGIYLEKMNQRKQLMILFLIVPITSTFIHNLFDGQPAAGISGVVFSIVCYTGFLSKNKLLKIVSFLLCIIELSAFDDTSHYASYIHIGGIITGLLLYTVNRNYLCRKIA